MSRSFLSAAPSATRDALLGFALAHADSVAVHDEMNFAYGLATHPRRRVALVSGGGSGHEPMHASFIGTGGLDAACPGEIFASPNNRQIYEASRAVALPEGVLHIVKNYTGDRINFGIAAERLRADGVDVGTVIVDDDLGSEQADGGVGRRGTAATVIVEKVLGAAADDGLSLDALMRLGDDIVRSSRSIAVASRAHTAPSGGGPAFAVTEGTLEYGVGIHGETAASTIEQPALADLVGRMTGEILQALPADADRDQHILLVNGLGGVSNLELQHILVESHRALRRHGVSVASAHAGTYVSALDMRGFSITLTRAADDWLPLWLAAHGTPGLPRPESTERAPIIGEIGSVDSVETGQSTGAGREHEPREGASAVLSSLDALFEAKRAALNLLDQASGDGDMGSNLASGMSLARIRFRDGTQEPGSAPAELHCIAAAFLDGVGGSSGPFFGLLFQQLALAADDESELSAWIAEGLGSGLDAIQRVGNAAPGDRTLVDALHPAVYRAADGARRNRFDRDAVLAAIDGAASTAALVARRGRASYVGARALGKPDPGAVGVALVLVELLRLLDEEGAVQMQEHIDAEFLHTDVAAQRPEGEQE